MSQTIVVSHQIVRARIVAAFLGTISLAACSGQSSPTAPTPPTAAVGSLDAKGPASVPGIYELAFTEFTSGIYQQVSSLPVGTAELTLKAYVTDSAGQPAQRGTVNFEYCSYKSRPRNDITRPDEAPKDACTQGLARWVRLASRSVAAGSCPTLGTGYACVNFGVVRIPRDIGFRIQYEPQGSGIAAGVTTPENFSWVAGS